MQYPIVFLVDAFPDESAMYAEYFATQGVTVRVFDSPRAAAGASRTVLPDVVITRIRQHADEMDGIALTASLKRDSRTRLVKIVVITTSILRHHREAAIDAGCDGYFLLPLMPDDLLGAVRMLLVSSASLPPQQT